MLNLPSHLLQIVHVIGHLAFMVALQRFSARVAEIVSAATGHVSTALCLLNHLLTSLALTILLVGLQELGHLLVTKS